MFTKCKMFRNYSIPQLDNQHDDDNATLSALLKLSAIIALDMYLISLVQGVLL